MTHTNILQELVVVVMTAVAPNIRKKVFFKFALSLQIALMKQNIPQVDDAHYIDLVMPRYILIE